jgi:small-conductance mechanosensitive channel
MIAMTKLKAFPRSLWIAIILGSVLGLLALQGFAQDQNETPAKPDSSITGEEPAAATAIPDTIEISEALGDSTAMVVLGGKELFPVHGESILGADERAAGLSEAIGEIAKSFKYGPEDLRTVKDERIKATLLLCDRVFLGAVWEYEAEALGVSEAELANERLEIIRQAIIDYRSDFSSGSIIKAVIYAVVATILLVVLLTVISRLRRRLENSLEQRIGTLTLFKVLKGEVLVDLFRAVNRLVYFVTLIWMVLAYLNFLLSLFPWTYGIASQVYGLAAGPLKAFGTAFLEQIPSFFFLAFIIIGTVFLLRGIRFFFHEVERGRIRISGFYPEWGRPTFNIVRLIVISFSIVVAFPYIPGSSSGAFKGMSLFIGLLVSIGSGGAMANVISGIILIYMRPFAIGDRIQIGETVGDVVDRNLLTTRLRTPKNERVTIPNTNILAGQIINFTSKARTKELILHTSVTIGYDVPWRQVHELLIGAAKASENVMEDPEPFVLQKGLNDFYIEYELNAYTEKPRQIPASYSELHQNIQDQFNEAGVEILSPHFRVMREDDQKN